MSLYPRGPHTPKATLMMDMTPRILDWFDEHLGRSSGVGAATDL